MWHATQFFPKADFFYHCSVATQKKEIQIMGRRRKEISMPHLNNRKGDLAKEWYVEFTIAHPVTGERKPKRIYENINKPTTYYEREKIAKKIIAKYTRKIKSGWRPWDEYQPFTDELAYKSTLTFTPAISHEKSYIKPLIADYIVGKKPTVNKSTIEDYRSKLRQFCLYLESKKCLHKELSFFDNKLMVSFLRDLHEKGMARKTVSKYQQVIAMLFEYIRKKRKIDIPDPFSEEIPRMGKIVDQAPTAMNEFIREMFRQEIEQSDPQLWLAINFVYYTAIRPRTELRLLQIKQINFTTHSVTVKNELAKNNRTESIDIPDQLFHLIVNVWKLHKANPELYLFGTNGKPGKKPLGKNTMGNRFVVVRRKLDLPDDIKLYGFKHSSAQELLVHGANIYDIKAHLRHSSLQTTESYLRKRFGNRNDFLKKNFPGI